MSTRTDSNTDQSNSRGRRRGRVLSPSVTARAAARGFAGGLIGTAVMTLYRLPIFRALPPTAEFWARYVGGGEAEDHLLPGIVLHFFYGAAAGGVFAPVFTVVASRTSFSRELIGLVSGLLYGSFLSVFGTRVIFRHVLGRELESDEALVFHVGHVFYGVTLGTWLSSRERFGEVYE